LCGIFISHLLPKTLQSVIITDIGDAIELIDRNISNNPPSCHIHSLELCWGNVEHYERALKTSSSASPLIIASDCVYWEHLFIPLIDCLLYFTSRGSRVIMSHVKRWKKDERFFRLCKKKNKTVKVLHEVIDHDLNSRNIMRIIEISY